MFIFKSISNSCCTGNDAGTSSPQRKRNGTTYFSEKYPENRSRLSPKEELSNLMPDLELPEVMQFRKFKKILKDAGSVQRIEERSSSSSIRVVQYNVLADIYTSKDRYYYCPSWALDWNYRKWKLLMEMLEYNPDVLCLQEVDHWEFWDEELQRFGYTGVYQRRPSVKEDGVAIFYKKSKFSLQDIQCVDFNKLKADDVPLSVSSYRYIKNNVGLVLVLESIEKEIEKPKQTFVVAATHTYWDPKLSDLKLRQSHMLLDELQYFLRRRSLPSTTPLIICGDFNSLPNSAVYELYSKGRVSGNHSDSLNYTSKKDFTHSFKLSSAYSQADEPLTNLTPWFQGTLDYIWYSNDQLELESILEMVHHVDILNENQILALPTPMWSSDHMSLVCDLRFKSSSSSSPSTILSNEELGKENIRPAASDEL